LIEISTSIFPYALNRYEFFHKYPYAGFCHLDETADEMVKECPRLFCCTAAMRLHFTDRRH
jgi:hypothetical protein